MKGVESLEMEYCTTTGVGESGREAGTSNTDDGKVLIRPKGEKSLTAEVVGP